MPQAGHFSHQESSPTNLKTRGKPSTRAQSLNTVGSTQAAVVSPDPFKWVLASEFSVAQEIHNVVPATHPDSSVSFFLSSSGN